jgi:hypothetical protein
MLLPSLRKRTRHGFRLGEALDRELHAACNGFVEAGHVLSAGPVQAISITEG